MIFLTNPFKLIEDYSYETNPPAGTFETITNNVIEVESEFYQVVKKGSIYVLAIMLIVGAIGLLVSSTNARERMEKKKFLIRIILVVILAFSAVSIGLTAYTLGLDD